MSFRWDVASALPVVLQDNAGNTYVYGLDLISRTDSSGNQESYLTDGLGSTTDVFGAIQSQTGSSPNEFKFTGEQMDGSGLQFLRARYYDDATGRFLGRDPAPYLQRYASADRRASHLIHLSSKGDEANETEPGRNMGS